MIPMKFFVILLAAASSPGRTGGPSNENSATVSTTTNIEVCLSPACKADGAEATLKKLQALAPPGVDVQPGVCSSICGSGPVVICNQDTKCSKHRRVKGKKILDLLLESCGNEAPPQPLLEGYDLVVQGDEAFAKKDYATAVVLYESAMKRAFRPAMELQESRDKMMKGSKQTTSRTPVALMWLVRARRNEASAKLALGDVNGALFASQASCNLSRNTCPESFMILADIYREKGNAADELEALKNMFALPVDETKLSFAIVSRRRELKFRLEKLEREVKR